MALFNAVAKAKRDTVLEESKKVKAHNEDDTIFSRESNPKSLVGSASSTKNSVEPSGKNWKVIKDDTDDIPMVSCNRIRKMFCLT